METIFGGLLAILAYYLVCSLDINSGEKSESSYINLGDGKWITPKGYVDMNPGLSAEQQLHNWQGELEEQMDDIQYNSDCAFAKWKAIVEIYKRHQPKIDVLTTEERLTWLEKYLAWELDWKTKDKDDFERDWTYMNLDQYIAWNMHPFPELVVDYPFKKIKGRIVYV